MIAMGMVAYPSSSMAMLTTCLLNNSSSIRLRLDLSDNFTNYIWHFQQLISFSAENMCDVGGQATFVILENMRIVWIYCCAQLDTECIIFPLF